MRAASLLSLVLVALWGHAPATDLVPAESRPAESLPCFPGAYYRKAVSAKGAWTGIEGTVVLPGIEFDSTRRNPRTGKMLDNASVYIGGHAGDQEIDAGLTWEVVREPNGAVSTERRAFRPFWRNKAWFNAPAKPELYFFPGDTIRMRCEVTEPGRLALTVEVMARGAVARQELPKWSGASADTPSSFTTTFDAPGFGQGLPQEFKRVNAIDQVGNEGRGVTPTRTRVGPAAWLSAYLLRGTEQVPFVPARYTDMRCPDATLIGVEIGGEQGPSGEKITIQGAAPAP